MFPVLLAIGSLAAGTDPPHIVTGKISGGMLVQYRSMTINEARTVTSKVNVGGMVVDETRTVMVPVTKIVAVNTDLKGATITDAEGTKLDLATAAKRLEKPAPLVVSSDFKPVDPLYLKLFKKDVIVIVPAKPGPPPMPDPPGKP